MNIIKAPQQLTPSKNPVIYQFGSTYSNILFFDITLKDTNTNATILTDKSYVTPINTQGTAYNINDVSQNLVKWEIVNTSNIVEPITDSIRKIYLQINEIGLTNSQLLPFSPTYSTTPIQVWNAKLNRVEFSNYNYNDYYLSSSQSSVKFLTKKPNEFIVNDYSREFLYFIKNETYNPYWAIQRLSATGSIAADMEVQITSTQSMYRLDVSPKIINTNYPGFLTQSALYQVCLKDPLGITVSEVKTYSYDCLPCEIDMVNILWENDLGGIDSYQFIQPLESRDVERTTIEKSEYDYNSNLDYVDIEGDIYNQRERIINVNLNSTHRMWTKPLTDTENLWLAGLLHSKNVWLELNSGRIYPVSLVETNYTIERTKYNNTQLLQTQWTFKIVGDYIVSEDIIASDYVIPTTTTTTTTSTTTTTTTIAGTTTTTTLPMTTTTTTLAPMGNTVSVSICYDQYLNGQADINITLNMATDVDIEVYFTIYDDFGQVSDSMTILTPNTTAVSSISLSNVNALASSVGITSIVPLSSTNDTYTTPGIGYICL